MLQKSSMKRISVLEACGGVVRGDGRWRPLRKIFDSLHAGRGVVRGAGCGGHQNSPFKKILIRAWSAFDYPIDGIYRDDRHG
jgi:hypothetical protein